MKRGNSGSKSEKVRDSDCYGTPQWLIDLCVSVIGPPSFDPFGNRESALQTPIALFYPHQCAYGVRWAHVVRSDPRGLPLTSIVNGGYSGNNPQRTADKCEQAFLDGFELISICPAAIGSAYWRERVLPVATAWAALGRVAFPALVDMYNNKGDLVCPKGEARSGNRTEIAAVHYGDRADRFVRVFGRDYFAERLIP